MKFAVAPYVGAWIETYKPDVISGHAGSHPTWVRGLKLRYVLHPVGVAHVAPYVGAWIETVLLLVNLLMLISRTLRGCVD